MDGGSSVAVLTYLRRILEALDHPEMIHLILHYLLALPDPTPTSFGTRASVSAARKRKSMDLATMMSTQMEAASTPALFNLVDLIQASLRSLNEQTISVTLQLVSVILRRHHRYAVTTLLWTSQVLADGPQRTIGAHEMEMDFLLALAGKIGTDADFDEIFDNHVKDCVSLVESHNCSVALLAPRSPGGTSKFTGGQPQIADAPRDVRSHTLRPEDPMLKTLLLILATFFTNSVETNLSLTGAIIDLATCGFMKVDGWLLPDPSKCVYDDDEEDSGTEDPLLLELGDPIEAQEKSHLRNLKKARKTPKWSDSHAPSLLKQLKSLVDQIDTYRVEIPRFDDLLQQRREAFQSASMVAATPVPKRQQASRSSNDTPSRSVSPHRPSALDALAQRIFPDLNTSRSNTPRGRNGRDRSSSGPGNSHGHATPTSLRNAMTPPQFLLGIDHSSRGSSRAISPSPLHAEKTGGKSVPASQVAAFAAIEQSILARKVSQPLSRDEIAAIPFPDLQSAKDDENSTADAVQGDNSEDDEEPKDDQPGEKKMVSVSHVLTNAIVLQDFLLELAALVQIRAGLFGEVRYV